MESVRGAVATAGDSIVEYANWIASGEPPHPLTSAILKGIRDYNEDDCRSTAELVVWLRKLQCDSELTFLGRPSKPEVQNEGRPEGNPIDITRKLLLAEAYDGAGKRVRPHLETLAYLLDFHRREDKPMWWRMSQCLLLLAAWRNMQERTLKLRCDLLFASSPRS